MTAFVLPVDLERQILDHAIAGGDCEVGGFCVGPAGRQSTRIVRMGNVHPDPTAHIAFLPSSVEALFTEMDAAGEDHFGVYHSHPVGPHAVPSTWDIAKAEDLDTVHLVVAPQADPSIRAWRVVVRPDGGRTAQEVPILRVDVGRDIETIRHHLAPDNVVALAYAASGRAEDVTLPRVRVVRMWEESVVVLHERRQITIGLDRIRWVQMISEASGEVRRREFAARLLAQAVVELDSSRVGSARDAIEGACRALPGLRPRMES